MAIFVEFSERDREIIELAKIVGFLEALKETEKAQEVESMLIKKFARKVKEEKNDRKDDR